MNPSTINLIMGIILAVMTITTINVSKEFLTTPAEELTGENKIVDCYDANYNQIIGAQCIKEEESKEIIIAAKVLISIAIVSMTLLTTQFFYYWITFKLEGE